MQTRYTKQQYKSAHFGDAGHSRTMTMHAIMSDLHTWGVPLSRCAQVARQIMLKLEPMTSGHYQQNESGNTGLQIQALWDGKYNDLLRKAGQSWVDRQREIGHE